VEIRQTISTSEQNRLVDDWFNRRPVKPAKTMFSLIKQNNRLHKESGWPEYERDMSAWRLETRTFFKWWPTNDHVYNVLLKSHKDTHVL